MLFRFVVTNILGENFYKILYSPVILLIFQMEIDKKLLELTG